MGAEFARRGIETAGISSLEYFWHERTPKEAADDLEALIRSEAGDRKIVLVGYSFGADVLPFIYATLPPQIQARIVRLNLLGLSSTADFEFHLSSWADDSTSEARQTVPFINTMARGDIICIRGTQEAGSACPAIRNSQVQQVVLPGDHHFNDDAKAIVDAFLGLQHVDTIAPERPISR